MPKTFRFGVVTGAAQSRAEWEARARRIEELGYATLLMPDRLQLGLAPFAALSVAAAATTTLRVGSFVFCNDYRHPALLAKEAATLDLLSGGRFELGIGAGVGPSDYRQMHIPFESPGVRVGRVEEAVRIIKLLFSEEIVNFSGEYYTISELRGLPEPVQRPHPPIFIGSAGKRLLSFAAREADSIAPTLKFGPQGADPNDATLEQKLAWLREAAGEERFARLELGQTVFDILIGSDAEAQASRLPPFMPRTVMSVEQAVERLLELRERYGFTYFQVNDAQMESFAPVVARLAGK